MALINCPECGNQMSDTAKKCPKCGYSVNRPQKLKWVTIIGVFGVANFIAGLICLFVEANHYPYGISLMCGLLAIYTYLIGSNKFSLPSRLWAFVYCTIAYNIFLYLAIHLGRNIEDFDEYDLFPFGNILYFIIFLIWLYSKDIKIKGSNIILKICLMLIMVILPLIKEFTNAFWPIEKVLWYSDEADTEELYNSFDRDTMSTSKSPDEDFIGVWEYIQPENNSNDTKLILTINDDETAVAKATQRGEEKTYYGSWSRYGDNIRLSFTDAYFTWNGRTTSLLDAWINWGEAINVDGAVIRDGYLYANSDMAKAKNPENRVKLEKAK